MARLQGLTHRSANEEEPGKIIHEYRAKIVDGKPINARQRDIFANLSRRWGGDGNKLVYFGSIDSTPFFIRVLHEYCGFYGTKILEQEVQRRDGQAVTMLQVMAEAIGWLESKLEASKSGLLEYRAHNDHGIKNQAWKDSNEFYIHENGRSVNHERPVASVEVQALI